MSIPLISYHHLWLIRWPIRWPVCIV